MLDQAQPKAKITFTSLLLAAIFLINITSLALTHRQTQFLKDINNTPAAATTSVLYSQITPPPPAEIDQLKAEISQLRAETRTLKAVLGSKTPDGSLSSLLPELELTATRSVTISDPRFNQIEVFELPLASSKVVGKMFYGVNYSFTSKQGEWYQVILNDGTFGWIHASLVNPL